MKTFYLSTLLFIIYGLVSCENPSKVKEKYPDTIDNHTAEQLKDSIDFITKEEMQETEGDPIMKREYVYKNFKSVAIGTPDYKGRYYWTFELYKITGSDTFKIKNSELFVQSSDKLVDFLNKEIKEEYTFLANDTNTAECFEGRPDAPVFDLNQFGVEFTKDYIEFNVYFGLGSACMSQDWMSVKLKYSEIKEYIE